MRYSLQDFQRYRVTSDTLKEGIRQSLYDFQIYATAGVNQQTFFAQNLGTGNTSASGVAAATAKSLADTNMTLAGQLPSGLQQLVESIEVHFLPGSVAAANTFTLQTPAAFLAVAAATFIPSMTVNDANAVLSTGFLQLNILAKPYLTEAPLLRFPPKCYLGLDAAIASNSATTGEAGVAFARAMGRPYYMEPPVVIDSTTNFSVTLNWPAAVATTSGFNARIGVVLDGFQARLSQ